MTADPRGWLEAAERLADAGETFVLVTLAAVRGHAPRGPGTKMVIARDALFGTVGGGDLEARCIAAGRRLLREIAAGNAVEPELTTVRLTPAGGEHGVQCCGGEVTVLLEPIRTQVPTIAVFGSGHVGRALVQALSILRVEIVLVDSRNGQLGLADLPKGSEARLERRHEAVPEAAIEGLPPGAHVVILTHDHAEDIAILDTALRRDDLGYVGLIGSSAKWSHFQGKLREQGHDDAALARVTTPIGLPSVAGKTPGAIAIATAAQLVSILATD